MRWTYQAWYSEVHQSDILKRRISAIIFGLQIQDWHSSGISARRDSRWRWHPVAVGDMQYHLRSFMDIPLSKQGHWHSCIQSSAILCVRAEFHAFHVMKAVQILVCCRTSTRRICWAALPGVCCYSRQPFARFLGIAMAKFYTDTGYDAMKEKQGGFRSSDLSCFSAPHVVLPQRRHCLGVAIWGWGGGGCIQTRSW